MTDLSIVIPCYNEAENIPLIVNRLTEILEKETTRTIEIVLVNNGSTDNSKEVFKAILTDQHQSNFKVVHIKENQGYGHGILEGLSQSKGDTLSWTHADMQTDPYDVIKAYDSYISKDSTTVFVKGKRKNRRLLEAFFTFGMQVVALVALKTYLDDINAQPKLFSRAFYSDHIKDNAPLDFSLDLYTLYKAKTHATCIIEIPVYFKKRQFGEAKGGGSWKTRIKLIKRTLAYIFELKKQII